MTKKLRKSVMWPFIRFLLVELLTVRVSGADERVADDDTLSLGLANTPYSWRDVRELDERLALLCQHD